MTSVLKILPSFIIAIACSSVCAQRVNDISNKAHSKLDSLQFLLFQRDLPDTSVVIIRNEIANQYIALGVPDSAILQCLKNLEFIKGRKISGLRFRVFLTTADSYRKSGNREDALFYYKEAMVELEHGPQKRGAAQLYLKLGKLFDSSGELDSALYFYKRSLENIEGNDNIQKRMEANILTNIGVVYSLQGNNLLSLQYLLQSLKKFEELNDEEGVAAVLGNIGATHVILKNYERGLNYYFKSLRILEGCIDCQSSLRATALMNISEVYFYLNKPDSAILNATKSVAINKSNSNKNELAYSFHYLSLAYRVKRDWPKSISSEEEAFSLHQKCGDKNGSAESAQGIAEIYIMTHQYLQAIHWGTLSAKIARDIGAAEVQKKALRVLAVAHARVGNPKFVSRFWESYDSLNEILYSKESVHQFANMEALYENEKKNKEIELLKGESALHELSLSQHRLIRDFILVCLLAVGLILGLVLFQFREKRKDARRLASQKEELARQNESLEKLAIKLECALADKELLLKEIHHRVKNNLQIITSLLNLQANTLKDNDASNVLRSAQERILSISLIHQRLYKNEELVGVEFKSYLNELAKSLKKSYQSSAKKIEFCVEGNDFLLPADTAMPIGLIVTELITNSYKHAFSNCSSGFIAIRIERPSAKELTVEYRDSGPGLPGGFDIRNKESLGMKLISRLVDQLQGHFTIRNDNGYYAKFVLAKI